MRLRFIKDFQFGLNKYRAGNTETVAPGLGRIIIHKGCAVDVDQEQKPKPAPRRRSKKVVEPVYVEDTKPVAEDAGESLQGDSAKDSE